MLKAGGDEMSQDVNKRKATKVYLDQKTKAEVDEVASEFGISTSALITYIVGQYLLQHRTVTKPMLSKLSAEVVGILGSDIKNLLMKQAKG